MLRDADQAIEIAVTDTGIGIPEDKQKLIFEAFQQADGTTSRKYGGTGLGLSISREIARLLGGELQVRSKPGEGSTFTLFVPLEAAASPAPSRRRRPAPATTIAARWCRPRCRPSSRSPTTATTLGDEPFVLIVEDDPTFASILLDLARDAGLKGVVSTAGAGTLALARKLQPHAITLDLGLSDIDGFVLLDLLKHDPQTQHMPIHVISGADEARARCIEMGAFGVTEKPADQRRARRACSATCEPCRRPSRSGAARRQGVEAPRRRRAHVPELAGAKILIVDDDIRNIYSLTSVLESYDVEVLHAERGRDGILHPRADARHRRRADRHHDAGDGRL